VAGVVSDGTITTATSAARYDLPHVLTEQGTEGTLATLRWPVAVRGTVRVTLRCDNPI
jgi:hypothetical protein